MYISLDYSDTESADVLITRGKHIAYGGEPHSSNKHILAAESFTRGLFSFSQKYFRTTE